MRFGFALDVHPGCHPAGWLNFKNVVATLLKQFEILYANRPDGFFLKMESVAPPKRMLRSFGNKVPEVFEKIRERSKCT